MTDRPPPTAPNLCARWVELLGIVDPDHTWTTTVRWLDPDDPTDDRFAFKAECDRADDGVVHCFDVGFLTVEIDAQPGVVDMVIRAAVETMGKPSAQAPIRWQWPPDIVELMTSERARIRIVLNTHPDPLVRTMLAGWLPAPDDPDVRGHLTDRLNYLDFQLDGEPT
jgi:hypothetical protein